MKITHVENAALGEAYDHGVHASGLRVYVIPKKMATAYALFGTEFGSIDNHFTFDGREVVLPDGIAHFLEHKMFENEDGTDTFARYAATGANANAYTTFERTCYLFSATDKVYESLEILLDFVTHPYFTKETVEKELGIIGQEIRMYDDNPGWQLYFGMLTGLYHANTVRIDTAGTTETIAAITPELLFDAYGAFYDLHNMALVICGDVTIEEVEKVCDKVLKTAQKPVVERIYPEEPKSAAKEFVSKRMEVAMPLFSVGIKDTDVPCAGRENAEKEAKYDILLELMFGKSSPFYTRLYEAGLIDSSFSFGYESSKTFAHAEISGMSKDPEAVYKAVREEIAHYRAAGFDKEDFERIRNAVYASHIRTFNSTEDTAGDFLVSLFAGFDLLDLPAVTAAVTPEDVERLLADGFADDGFVLSTILPKEKK